MKINSHIRHIVSRLLKRWWSDLGRLLSPALSSTQSGGEGARRVGEEAPDLSCRSAIEPGLIVRLLGFCLAALPLSQISAAAAAATANPQSSVGQVAKEADFNTVTLTPKAAERLGIKTSAVERKTVPRRRTFGGEIMVALNQPSVKSTETSENPQSILSLLPKMSPAEQMRIAEAQVDADGVVGAAKVQLEAARVALERAERMLRDKAGSQRAVDDARATSQLAQNELAKATARRELLGPPVLHSTTPKRLWVRVSVYVGDLSRIDPKQSAEIGGLGAANGDARRSATPVVAPPSADAAAASADLFFELDNADQRFQLGEKVAATLALKTEEQSLVVPWASVLTDINGGTWVYENTAEHQYVRRRIQIRHVSGGLAVLASGPPVGASIVTTGAAELFGTETGFAK